MAAKRKSRARRFRCEYCGWWRTRNSACGCSLYNAAVAAQKAAARSLAEARTGKSLPREWQSWLNEHGIFAQPEGEPSQQIGTPGEAAPFVALTGLMNRVAQAILEVEAKGG